MANPTDESYESKYKKVQNVLKSSGLKVSEITKAGSRAKGTERPDSDLDMIYATSETQSEEKFHPELIEKLKGNFREDKVYAGENNNVVHIDFKSGEKLDLKMLSKDKFDEQRKSYKK